VIPFPAAENQASLPGKKTVSCLGGLPSEVIAHLLGC